MDYDLSLGTFIEVIAITIELYELLRMFWGQCGNLWTSSWLYGGAFVIVDSLYIMTYYVDIGVTACTFLLTGI
jgi:hypothetical protein